MADRSDSAIKGASIAPGGIDVGIDANGKTERNYPNGVPDGLSPELIALQMANELQRKKLEWVAWSDKIFTECKTQRQQFERQWFINMAFNAGRQYIAPALVPGYGFRLTTPRAPQHRVRLVINKTRKAVRAECARLTSSRPIPTVVPATNEREDLSAALLGEQLLKTRFQTAEFEQKYRGAVWWSVVTGCGFLKQYWDPGAEDHDVMEVPKPPMVNGQPLPQEILEKLPPEVTAPRPSKGKICIEKISPFYVYVPDLMADSIEAQPYIIHVMTKTPEWVRNVFGFMPTPDAASAATTLDTSMIIARGSEQRFDSVMVREVWIKPGAHRDFPNGGLLTVINNKLVQYKDKWPLPYCEYPFYKIDGIYTGGFYADSIIVDLIPLQKEYNKTRSKAVEIKNIQGVARLVYQEGSINPRKISTEAGQSIPYTAGYEKPDILPAVEVPQSYNNEIDRLAGEFDDLSGQHDLTQNGDPASGTAMAFLKEQDDELLVSQTASIEYAMQYTGQHYLKLASTYWDGDRVVKVAGKNQSYEALKWKKDSLNGNTDVRVQTGSALPQSKAARQAFITEMMQNGFIAPEAGLEILDLGDVDRMMDEYLTDKRQAMRENLKMAELPDKLLKMYMQPHPDFQTGQQPYEMPPDPMNPAAQPQMMNGDGTPFTPQPPIPTNSYDNDEAHIKWHNQYRKTEEFELLSDEHKQAFEMHVQSHQMNIQANQLNMQGQIVQPGMGGGMGSGSDPGGDMNPGNDPTMQGGGEPMGTDSQDSQFAEDPNNMNAAVGRARTVEARQGTGMFDTSR